MRLYLHDTIVPRAAQLTCTSPTFVDLLQSAGHLNDDDFTPSTDPASRQRLRDELDALIAHLYGLSRAVYGAGGGR